MSFNLESFIALRYLKGAEGRSEGRRFLKLVTFISVGGVAVGVATLILALSIVRGFSQEIQSKVIGFGAHVQVESIRDAPLEAYSRLSETIMEVEGVESVAPVIQEFVLLRRSSVDIEGVSIWGTNSIPDFIASSVLEGTASLAPDSTGQPGLIMGSRLAKLMEVEIGSVVTAFSVNTMSVGSQFAPPRLAQFRVVGIYETSLANFDELYVFVGLDRAVALLDYAPGEVTRLDVRVVPGLDYTISIIVFVAAINIVGTLLMIILEKTSEMGILASLGTTAKTRRRIFVRLGLYVGLSGVLIGEVMALFLALMQIRFDLIPLPAEAYYMKTAPIALSFVDFVLVAAITLILCAVSSYIPSRYAARIEPLRAIKSR